jgi:hypothetical protein
MGINSAIVLACIESGAPAKPKIETGKSKLDDQPTTFEFHF